MSVIPLNSNIDQFKKSLELLKKHQSLPVLLATIENCLIAKGSISLISRELSSIFHCSDDQFWGHRGSQYYRDRMQDLSGDQISKFRKDKPSYLSCFDHLGKIAVPSEINLENSFLNEDDFSFLHSLNTERQPSQDSGFEERAEDEKRIGLPQEISEALGEYIKEDAEFCIGVLRETAKL